MRPPTDPEHPACAAVRKLVACAFLGSEPMIFGPDPGHGGLRFVVVFSEGVEVRASDMAALSETTGARALKIDFDPGSVTTGDPAQLRIYMEIPSDA